MTASFQIISGAWQRKLYFAGILLLVASLPLSKFVMSVAQFVLLGSWLLSGNLKEKVKAFFTCKPAMAIAAVYLMHLAGMLWTTDIAYGLKDLRIKLPLLALPVIFASSPALEPKQFRAILLTLIAATAVSAAIGFGIWAGWTSVQVTDIRDITPFVSHIRLALLVCLSVMVGVYFMFVEHRYVPVLIPVTLALLAFLVLLESVTGLGILAVVLFIVGVRRSMYLESKWWRTIILTASAAIPLMLILYVLSVSRDFSERQTVDYDTLAVSTPSGNPYMHYRDRSDQENGKLVWIYVCEEELLPQWNKRSAMDYLGQDRKGQNLRFTLIRYMTSKGLRKDSAGVWSLSSDDIASIENGHANIYYTSGFSLYARMHQLIWEIQQYRSGGNPSGHSLTMRWEYWKTAKHIVAGHPWVGVGTGDLPEAFREQYVADGSRLEPQWRLRSHNQFLSIAGAFGIPGLALFVWMLIYTLRERLRKHDSLFLVFWLIAVFSMLTEDTLETQAGVTFFALFYCLFLFVNPQKRACNGINKV